MRSILFILACTTCMCGIAQRQVDLRLKWWHQFQFAGYYAADIKGFYQEEGIQVQLIPGDATHAVTDEVISDRAQFGITGSDILLEYAKGRPLVAIGAIFQHSPYVIFSLKKNNIRSPSDLVGKKLMVSEQQGLVEVKSMLVKEGIALNSVQLLTHSWDNKDLISEKVDALTGYISVEKFQIEKAGVEVNTIRPLNYGIDMYGDILFTSKEIADKDHELLEKFRRASFKGWTYAMRNKAEIADHILTLPGVQERGVTKEMLLKEAAAMDELILPELVEPGHMNEGRWQHMLDLYKGLGIIDQQVDLRGFLYTHPQSGYERFKETGLVLLAIAAMIIIVGLIYIYTVRSAVRVKTKELQYEVEQRKKTQGALTANQQQLQRILDQSLDMICSFDIHGRFIEVSKAAQTLLGYKPEELIGKIPDPMILPADLSGTHAVRDQIRSGKHVLNFENRYIHKNGNIIHLSWSARWDAQAEVMYCTARNVTDKKIAEERLQENQALFNAMIDHMNEGVALSTLDGHLLVYNKAMEQMLGKPMIDAPDLDWSSIYGFYYPDRTGPVPKERLPLVRALKGETSFNEEYLVIQEGRPDVHIVCSGIPIRNAAGDLIAGMTVKYDITAEKAAREQRIRTEEKYRTLVEHATDAIVIGDRTTRFLEANSAALKMFGYEKEEFYRLRLPDVLLLGENDPPLQLDAILRGETIHIERTARRKDGSIFNISISSKLLPDGNLLGMARDITERKKAEEQLRRHEQQLELIFNKVADTIFVLSVEAKGEYRFTALNHAFLKATGLTEEQVLNKYVHEVIPEPSLSLVLGKYQEAIDHKTTVKWEEKTEYPNGTKIGLVSVTPVIEPDGSCKQLIGSVHDITERELLISELTRNNKELKQFSFITSHNLRAPLTNLIAIADLIDTEHIPDKGTRDLIYGFKASTQKLNETLNDLINILVIRSQNNQVLTEVDLKEVYNDVVSSIGSMITDAQAIITTDFSAFQMIRYNHLYMESIFLNMLTNSIKYAHPDRTPVISISTRIHHGIRELIFHDNGIGIDTQNNSDRLFGLYQKFHDHPDSKGIGLYLVHSQVTSMGGSITAEGKPGEGTTFRIRFTT